MGCDKPQFRFLTCVALLISIPGSSIDASESEASNTSAGHPESFLEFGPWVFAANPKLIARCDGFQVLVVYANGTDMLFLDESAISASEKGMSFGEFNFYHAAYDIESVSCELSGKNTVQIHGTASNQHDDSVFRFRIVAEIAKRSYTYEDSAPK